MVLHLPNLRAFTLESKSIPKHVDHRKQTNANVKKFYITKVNIVRTKRKQTETRELYSVKEIDSIKTEFNIHLHLLHAVF